MKGGANLPDLILEEGSQVQADQRDGSQGVNGHRNHHDLQGTRSSRMATEVQGYPVANTHDETFEADGDRRSAALVDRKGRDSLLTAVLVCLLRRSSCLTPCLIAGSLRTSVCASSH